MVWVRVHPSGPRCGDLNLLAAFGWTWWRRRSFRCFSACFLEWRTQVTLFFCWDSWALLAISALTKYLCGVAKWKLLLRCTGRDFRFLPWGPGVNHNQPKFVAGLFFLPAGERPGGSVPQATGPVSCPMTTVLAPPWPAWWPGMEVSNQTKLWMNLTRKPSVSLSLLAMESVQAGFPQPCNLPNFHSSRFTNDWKPGTSGTSTWPWAGAGLVSIRARIFRLTNTDGAETGRGASRKARELRHRLGELGCCEGFHELPPVPLLPVLSS